MVSSPGTLILVPFCHPPPPRGLPLPHPIFLKVRIQKQFSPFSYSFPSSFCLYRASFNFILNHNLNQNLPAAHTGSSTGAQLTVPPSTGCSHRLGTGAQLPQRRSSSSSRPATPPAANSTAAAPHAGASQLSARSSSLTPAAAPPPPPPP